MEYLKSKEVTEHTKNFEDAIADMKDFGYKNFLLLAPYGLAEDDCWIAREKELFFLECRSTPELATGELTDRSTIAAMPLITAGNLRMRTGSALRLTQVIQT